MTVLIEHPTGNYTLSLGFDAVDMAVVERFFTSSEAYWTNEDSTDVRLSAWKNSDSWSLRDENGTMIGGFRLITDKSFFGYIADVFVLPEHRGHALAEWMLSEAFKVDGFNEVKRWTLRTKDMQVLYKKLGFKEPIDRDWELEKRR